MDFSRINELIEGRKWRDFLRALPYGDHTFTFNTVNDIKVCKATAYDMNSDRTGKRYTFNVNKDERKAVIHVTED